MPGMYKYGRVVAFCATVCWLLFMFSAFRGFHFWYAGFVFFFWLALASLNYRHDTSLWLFRNKFRSFFFFYLQIVVLTFFVDFIIGQRLTGFWSYPYYNSVWDWLRLLLVIYPFGGLAVLELVYFLAALFGERFHFISRQKTTVHRVVDAVDILWVYLLYFLIFTSPLLLLVNVGLGYRVFMFVVALGWPVVATIKFWYHIAHWLHWVLILVATALLSVMLHEFPNVGVFEWKYQNLPVLNQSILGIPLGVIFGWYVLVIGVFRIWLYFAVGKRQD